MFNFFVAVTNGPKDHVNEHEDFDTWRSQHHQVSRFYYSYKYTVI